MRIRTNSPATLPANRGENSIDRAERDLWTLLSSLHSEKLIVDIDEERCQRMLEENMEKLSYSAPVADVISISKLDDRIRKGSVLCEWLESSAKDLVTISALASTSSQSPWPATHKAVLRGQHRRDRPSDASLLQSFHPDAQVSLSGKMLPLDGGDRAEQESLLRSLWQLLRSGQPGAAKQLAKDRGLFWLAASLSGADLTSAEKKTARTFVSAGEDVGDIDVDPRGRGQWLEEQLLLRMGNTRRPVWIRSCWRYAEKLGNATDNWAAVTPSSAMQAPQQQRGTLAGILEMSIYATLSNHTELLMKSPLVATWADRVWVHLRAAHEADVSRLLHHHRRLRAHHTRLLVGCDDAVLQAEISSSDAAAGVSDLLLAVPPPDLSVPGKRAEALVLQLQAALMGGYSSLQTFLMLVVEPVALSSTSFPDKKHVLRIFCHLVLWLRGPYTAHPSNRNTTGTSEYSSSLAHLVSDDLLHHVVEAYVKHLIETRQPELVAVYLKHLCRPRRMLCFVQLLQSIRVPQLPLPLSSLLSSSTSASDLSRRAKRVVDDVNHEDNEDEEEMGGDDNVCPESRSLQRSVMETHTRLLHEAAILFPGEVADLMSMLVTVNKEVTNSNTDDEQLLHSAVMARLLPSTLAFATRGAEDTSASPLRSDLRFDSPGTSTPLHAHAPLFSSPYPCPPTPLTGTGVADTPLRSRFGPSPACSPFASNSNYNNYNDVSQRGRSISSRVSTPFSRRPESSPAAAGAGARLFPKGTPRRVPGYVDLPFDEDDEEEAEERVRGNGVGQLFPMGDASVDIADGQHDAFLVWIQSFYWYHMLPNPSLRLDLYKQVLRVFMTLQARTLVCEKSHTGSSTYPVDVVVSSAALRLFAEQVQLLQRRFPHTPMLSVQTKGCLESAVELPSELMGRSAASWRAVVDNLLLWDAYTVAIKCLETWRSISQAFTARVDRLTGPITVIHNSLGQDVTQLRATADRALAAIEDAINCEPGDVSYQSAGFGEVFARVESSVLADLHHELVSLHEHVVDMLRVSFRVTQDQLVSTCSLSVVQQVELFNHFPLFQELTEMLVAHLSLKTNRKTSSERIPTTTAPATPATTPTRAVAAAAAVYVNRSQSLRGDGPITRADVLSLLAPLTHVLSLLSHRLPTTQNTTISAQASEMCAIEMQLRHCLEATQDLIGFKFAAKTMLNHLLTSFLEVATGTAEQLDLIRYSKPIIWKYLTRATSLATLIASEQSSLQLYRIIEKRQLKQLMSTISKAALQSVDDY